MRAFTLGCCLAVAVTVSFIANALIGAALQPLRVPSGHARVNPARELRSLDESRLGRLFGTPLRPRVAPPPRRAIPLKLLGTLDDHAAAVLDPATGHCRTLRVGDTWDDIELVEVGHGAATVRRGGAIEPLGLRGAVEATPSDAAAFAVVVGAAGAKVSLSRAELERRFSELANQAMTGARLVPAFTEGAMSGLKLFAVRPGSIYEQLGLANGDVFEAVNGTPLASLDLGFAGLTRLRNQDRVQLVVNRGGQRLTWELNVN